MIRETLELLRDKEWLIDDMDIKLIVRSKVAGVIKLDPVGHVEE